MTGQMEHTTVLMTGATGFLGRACLAALAGKEIVATHRGPTPAPREGVTWVAADLADTESLSALCAAHRPTHLLALAWEMGPGYQTSVDNYRWIGRSVDLLAAFAANGGRRAVFCGSCMEYDWSDEAPLVEDVTPLRPDTDYGAAKAGLATVWEPLAARLGLSAAWARPFFLYGPGENPRRLAADVIVSLLEGREALCGAGAGRRDFLHVDDVAGAMTALLLSPHEGAFNIAGGAAVPMADLVGEIARQIGRPDLLRLGARPTRPGEPGLVEADITRLRDILGWRPMYTLQTGLADTIAWWRRELAKDGTS